MSRRKYKALDFTSFLFLSFVWPPHPTIHYVNVYTLKMESHSLILTTSSFLKYKTLPLTLFYTFSFPLYLGLPCRCTFFSTWFHVFQFSSHCVHSSCVHCSKLFFCKFSLFISVRFCNIPYRKKSAATQLRSCQLGNIKHLYEDLKSKWYKKRRSFPVNFIYVVHPASKEKKRRGDEHNFECVVE